MLQKRVVAIDIARGHDSGNYDAAIEALTRYLDNHMNDHEAWLELAMIHIRCQQHDLAAYCIEELILSHPRHHVYHTLYAEVAHCLHCVADSSS